MSTSISATEIGLPDNAKLKLGTGDDAEIFHNGTDTRIVNTTGDLSVRGGVIKLASTTGEEYFRGTANGSVDLFYDNVVKFSTNSDGYRSNDNVKAQFGNSSDLQIYHDGSHSYIDNTGTGNLYIVDGGIVRIRTASFGVDNANGTEQLISATANGAVELYYDNSKKIETTSAGVTVSGASDGVLNLDTTDSRGAFVRFGQGGSFHNMVGCADGLTSGDKEDLGVRAADNIIFASGGSTERMRIHSSGVVQISSEKLCIGTSATNAGVSDGMLVTEFNGSTKNGFKSRANPGASESQHIIFIQNSSEVGRIHTNNSSTSYATSSDYRLKENVTAISDGINRLKTLKPSRFNFIIDPDKTVDGFLAHEVTAVPEAISGTKDEVDSDNNPKYQTIDQSKLVPLLVAAVQELAAKVEALEAA